MPLSPALAHPTHVDTSSALKNNEHNTKAGAASPAIAASFGVLPSLDSRTSLRTRRTPTDLTELDTGARTMGGAVGGLNGLASIGGREAQTMTLTVDERGERATLRGSAGTLHLPGMPHALSRAYTAPVSSSPATPMARTGTGVGTGDSTSIVVRTVVGDDRDTVGTTRTSTTPAPALSGLMRPNAPNISPSLSPAIVASPTRTGWTGSGSPANTTAGVDADRAADTSALGAAASEPLAIESSPLSPDGTYTLPGYHFLAATVGADLPQQAGGAGRLPALPEGQPFASGLTLPNLFPSGSGSNADGSRGQARAPWEVRSGPGPDSCWAAIPPPVNAQNVAPPPYDIGASFGNGNPDTREEYLRRGGRVTRIEGWAPPPSASTLVSAFASSNVLSLPPHLQAQTPGAGPGPSTVRNVYMQESSRRHGHGHSQSGSLSGSGSPSSNAAGTPPQTGYDMDCTRYMSDMQAPFARSIADNVSTAAAYAMPYSNTYAMPPLAMSGHSYSHSQSLSPFASASTPPGPHSHNHATVPGPGTNVHMYPGARSMPLI